MGGSSPPPCDLKCNGADALLTLKERKELKRQKEASSPISKYYVEETTIVPGCKQHIYLLYERHYDPGYYKGLAKFLMSKRPKLLCIEGCQAFDELRQGDILERFNMDKGFTIPFDEDLEKEEYYDFMCKWIPQRYIFNFFWSLLMKGNISLATFWRANVSDEYKVIGVDEIELHREINKWLHDLIDKYSKERIITNKPLPPPDDKEWEYLLGGQWWKMQIERGRKMIQNSLSISKQLGIDEFALSIGKGHELECDNELLLYKRDLDFRGISNTVIRPILKIKQ